MKKVMNLQKRNRACLILIASCMIVMFLMHQLSNSFQYGEKNTCEFNCNSNITENITEVLVEKQSVIKGHCSLRASQLKDHQKVLSYCLYGKFSQYASGLPSILTTAKSLYPGWTVRLYCQSELYTEELGPLLQGHDNLIVCDVANLPGTIHDIRHIEPMLWRLAALADEQVDVVNFRDIDAIIYPRELAAVEEFIASGQTLHVMRDHPSHDFAILVGMFGVYQTEANRQSLADIRNILFKEGEIKLNKDKVNTFDQPLVEKYLYKQLVSSSLIHDCYHCMKYSPRGIPFPTQREGKLFIGNARYRAGYEGGEVTGPCPVDCRPKNHSDWLYC